MQHCSGIFGHCTSFVHIVNTVCKVSPEATHTKKRNIFTNIWQKKGSLHATLTTKHSSLLAAVHLEKYKLDLDFTKYFILIKNTASDSHKKCELYDSSFDPYCVLFLLVWVPSSGAQFLKYSVQWFEAVFKSIFKQYRCWKKALVIVVFRDSVKLSIQRVLPFLWFHIKIF